MIGNYIDEVRRTYPNLSIDDAYMNEDGQYNDVLVINDSLIFRFSKNRSGAETLRIEIDSLKTARDQLPI
jgi:aminoglycoside 2''-phosphotransferase